MITKEDYMKWGQKLFEKAKIIHRYELAHKSKVVQIIDNIKKKHGLSNELNYDMDRVEFSAFAMKGYYPGPEEVKVYWLQYITTYPDSFEYTSWEDSIKQIIENSRHPWVIEKFNEYDFRDSGEFELTYSGDAYKNLNIRVPYSLNYYQVEFAIQVIEKITRSKVSKISLLYFTNDPSCGNIYSDVYIAIDDNINKHSGAPFISKEILLNFKFTSFENWYTEIPEFKNYIENFDSNENNEFDSTESTIFIDHIGPDENNE